MRAKEYIEINKNNLEYPEQISIIIDHCAILRTDLSKTIQFYDCYLSTFENINRFLKKSGASPIKKEGFWKLLREELQPTIKNDKTYSYLYIRLSQEQDLLNKTQPAEEIQKCICQQFEDYPKSFIDDYITLEQNRIYYENICDIFSTSEDILYIFNTAYEIFDNIRIKMHKPIQASFYIKEYPCKSDSHKYFILPLVATYLKNYKYELSASQQKNKEKLSDELSKYIAHNIDPQSEVVKAKSYWYFFQNTLKIAIGENEKLALLITEQTKFNQLPESEKKAYGITFGQNCQLEIDKIRELQTLHNTTEEIEASTSDNEKRTFKVVTDTLMLILEQAGITTHTHDKAKIARLINYLTNYSEEKIRKRLSNTDELTEFHKEEVENINKILSSLDIKKSIIYNKQR